MAKKKKQASTTAGELSREIGVPLAEVSQITGVSMQTLDNWFKQKLILFKIVVYGCLWIKKFKIEL